VLKNVAQDVTLAKALKTIDRTRGVMRSPIVEIELAQLPAGKMQLDLLARTAAQVGRRSSIENEHPDISSGSAGRPMSL